MGLLVDLDDCLYRSETICHQVKERIQSGCVCVRACVCQLCACVCANCVRVCATCQMRACTPVQAHARTHARASAPASPAPSICTYTRPCQAQSTWWSTWASLRMRWVVVVSGAHSCAGCMGPTAALCSILACARPAWGPPTCFHPCSAAPGAQSALTIACTRHASASARTPSSFHLAVQVVQMTSELYAAYGTTMSGLVVRACALQAVASGTKRE